MHTITLKDLRGWAGLTQAAAARAAGTTQSELSRLERRSDFLLSTLRDYVRALGGSVEVRLELGSTTFSLAHDERPLDAGDARRAVATLASLPTWLPALVARVPVEHWTARIPSRGEFSVVEHVCHLRDLDLQAWPARVEALRQRRHPVMPDFDGARAAKEARYQRQPLEAALAELVRQRKRLVKGLGRLSARSLEATGTLEGVGEVTLGAVLSRWAGHDGGHRADLERLVGALEKRA